MATTSRTSRILLNAELAATVALAALVFREHLGARMWLSAGLIIVAGGLLTWQPGAGIDIGALLVVAACIAWGFDNGVTAGVEQLAPEHVVVLKGVIAGGANLAIGLIAAGWGADTTAADVFGALAIGAAGYGWSITLWVRGARDLGAARSQVIFATAPFIGAVVAWTVLGDDAGSLQMVATVIAAVGIAVSLRSAHEHTHQHHNSVHEHEHRHDDGHHDHFHDDEIPGRHTHLHEHRPLVHAHPHVPDLHHRHRHDH